MSSCARFTAGRYFNEQEYLNYLAEEPRLRTNFRDRRRVLRSLKPDLGDAELLERGCAYGFFLDEVRRYVPEAWGRCCWLCPTQRHVEPSRAHIISAKQDVAVQ
jgi:hypothetical protein